MPPKRTRQTRLDFSNAAKKRKVKPDDDGNDAPAFATPKESPDLGKITPQRRDVQRGMEMGSSVLRNRKGMFGSSDNENFALLESSSESPVPQPKKSKKERGKKTAKPKIVSSSESEEDVAPAKRTRSAKNVKKGKKKVQSISSDEDSAPAQHPHISLSSDDESSDQGVVATPRRSGRRSGRRSRRHAQITIDSEVDLEDSEDELAPPSTRKRKRTPDESDSEEENDGAAKGNHQEKMDLQEDLDFLKSSPPPDKGRLRSTQSKPLNKRQEALEALKRRRAGNSSVAPSSSATPARKRAVILEDSDSDELEIIREDKKEEDIRDHSVQESSESEEQSDDAEDGSSTQNTNPFDMFKENEEDGDFIDDDADDPIGAPAELTALPLEFSSLGRAKPRELFKYAVEWMVQKKINPAFSSTDEIYTLSFRKLDDEVNGLASSKFSSSAWTSGFTRALRARPDVTIDEIGQHIRAISSPHCEACNRKTHPATFNICFTGKPYNKSTLEPLVDSDTEDSDESDVSSDSGASTDSDASESGSREKKTYDATGEIVPPESKVFTVGSTCKANAQMAHTLHHWRHHLNSWVIDYLASKGHLKEKKVAKRDKWSVEKRRKKADKIVDKMEKAGEIQNLYRLYKDQLDYALEAKNDYKRGWGRK
ncbi:hypothetical protein BU24DRAFT_426443 [Aaosphaeria arxii CBS 175.79]|uniref:DUF4211 domain-containing protein n=1 Tax=Aaosphaeria arxii CBS 175.79 TaxID=1450172 RepID=A0A6A5XEU3_9PLEO|nr:uncharacterized protein BU24DRAFT_426443 [Aaosphaeria arxii CBS 175.79]KAF2011366.1 hypothetical protein BU24DRAFT_426443 [Aaosphaeria arxii CBS 175.79]